IGAARRTSPSFFRPGRRAGRRESGTLTTPCGVSVGLARMGYRVVRYQETPNPNAVKCYLDRPAGAGVRSYFSAEEAAGDPLAAAVVAVPGGSSVLMNGGWMTVGRRAEGGWREVKAGVERVIGGVET